MAKKKRKKRGHYSGIGGQAVLEGIMMKNGDKYSVAVRKPNGEIEVELDTYHGILDGSKIKNIPFIRGVFNFLDSLILGTRSLNFSATFYEDEDEQKNIKDPAKKARQDKALTTLTTVFAVILALALFMALPYYASVWLGRYVRNASLMAIIEGIIRIVIFVLYVAGISLMPDIKRVYRYHGAEHKCINCIEHGHTLTVENVMKSSKQHKRCGTSFLLFVMLVSVILFFFIRVESPLWRLLLRLLLIPVIAGISYELIRLAGRSNNILVKIISAPGLWLQRLTTKEPDEQMVEVAIKAVEAVFDWKQFLREDFNYKFPEDLTQEDIEDGISSTV